MRSIVFLSSPQAWRIVRPCCSSRGVPLINSVSAHDICGYKGILTDVPGRWAEEVADILIAEGAAAASIEEHRPPGVPEQEIFEGNEARVWDRCTIVTHYGMDVDLDIDVSLRRVKEIFELQNTTVTVQPVWQEDWEAAVKEAYKPIQLQSNLWIVPSWLKDQPPHPQAVNVFLEPGLAFGTGDHPTTRLCLSWLASSDLKEKSLLDYGTGSGILMISALVLGVRRAVGTDIDPLSLRAATQAAVLNDVVDSVSVYAAAPIETDTLEDLGGPFDITVANILQGPLMALAPRLAHHTIPGGTLGLSGILTSQVSTIEEKYSQWFDNFELHTEGKWALLTATKK